MADTKTEVYPFFGDKQREELEAKGYEILKIEHTPALMGHGGDAIVSYRQKSSFKLLQEGRILIQ